MIVMMRCVAEAVAAKGLRGVSELMAPGVGPYLYDVAADAVRRLKEQRRQDQIRQDLLKAAQSTFEEAKATAEAIAREVAGTAAEAERQSLQLLLMQMPGVVRRSLRRKEDPTGTTVPAGFVLDTPEEMLRYLPAQLPRFRPGMPLPNRPGWTLAEPLGAGGFGEVWKVVHDLIPEPRAVKFCTDPAAKDRLLKHEGKLVARVMKEGRHPNVVALIDADLSGETPWLAYEYVGGGDLTGLILKWQQLPPAERIECTSATLRTLAETTGHFHTLAPPIVHRDLKPANILVDRNGTVKITDFGIGSLAAQKLLAEAPVRDAPTRAVTLLAGSYTPIYASPQQQKGEAADPRDDVHALGVIAYQMLTGRLDQAPGPKFDRPLRTAGVPDDLIETIGDCIDEDAEHRPANGTVLAEKLPEPEMKARPGRSRSGSTRTAYARPTTGGGKALAIAGWVLLGVQAGIIGLATAVAFSESFLRSRSASNAEFAFACLIVCSVAMALNLAYARSQPALRRLAAGLMVAGIFAAFVLAMNYAESARDEQFRIASSGARSQEAGALNARFLSERLRDERIGGVLGTLAMVGVTTWFVRGRPLYGLQSRR